MISRPRLATAALLLLVLALQPAAHRDGRAEALVEHRGEAQAEPGLLAVEAERPNTYAGRGLVEGRPGAGRAGDVDVRRAVAAELEVELAAPLPDVHAQRVAALLRAGVKPQACGLLRGLPALGRLEGDQLHG